MWRWRRGWIRRAILCESRTPFVVRYRTLDTRHCGMRVFQRPKNCPRVGGPRRDRIRREVLVDLRIYTMGGVLRRVYTSASNSSPRAPHLMSKKRVLLTDDHASIRYLLRRLIETDQFTVCGEAANGGEAILKAAALAPDLILLDFVMPGMNGGETARTLKTLMPLIPIILFTLDEDSVNEALAVTMGVDAVLAKPDAALHLLDCMRSVLGLRTEPSTAVGPLAVPIQPASEPSQPADPTVTEDKPPQ